MGGMTITHNITEILYGKQRTCTKRVITEKETDTITQENLTRR